MAFILTRVNVGDYEAWRPIFDQDGFRVREAATGFRIFRGADDANEVFLEIEYASVADAKIASERMITSGVLDRFSDSIPTVVEVSEAATP